MKRTIQLFSLLLLMLFSLQASAEDCTISELGVTVTLPDGYNVITRETVKNASLPDDMGMSLDMMEEYLVENQIYLYTVSPDYAAEITLTSGTTNHNTHGLSEGAMELVAEQVEAEYEAEAQSVREMEIHTGENNFILFRFADKSLQYYTAKDGQAYRLTLRPTGNGTVTSVHTNDLQNMANSLLLSGVPQAYATEIPDYLDHIEGERPVSPLAAVGVFAAIIAVSAIVLFAMKPKKKTKR